MNLALSALDSWVIFLLPILALLLLFRSKQSYEAYLSIICAINLGFAGWLLGSFLHLGHWCIPCIFSASFALIAFFLSKNIPKLGSFLFAFSLAYLFYPLLWTLVPGVPELQLILVTGLWGIMLGLRSLKWDDNFNLLICKAYAGALLIQSSLLSLSKMRILREDAIVNYNYSFHFAWVSIFIFLIIISYLFKPRRS